MFDDNPNKLESAFIQRNASNTYYSQINISGSNLIFYHSSSGELTADNISIWAQKYGIGTLHQSKTIMLCMGTTPLLIGSSSFEVPVPYSSDGISAISWTISRINLRVHNSGSSPTIIAIEKSTGNGIFSPVVLSTITLTSNTYETFTGSLNTISSGDKMRFNTLTLGTAQEWTIAVEIASL